jgi:3-hydroxyacyl-CoA dehydrogenase
MSIRKVAVIGAGVMGAGIAAQVANAGLPVLLLDIVPEGASNRNAVAEGAVARMLKAQPAPFMSKSAAKLVETGNIEDDLGKLAECDWVVEAIIERLDLKQSLYRRIEAVRRPGTAVSSNTSTIPLGDLVAGIGDAFARDFMITHFFNPPRYMRLLEVVAGPQSDPALVATVSEFADRTLGKSIVRCKDSPGFIANRLGCYWMTRAVRLAIEQHLTVEEADAVNASPFGIPKTGVFGLSDLVGLDLMPHVNKSMRETLPENDWFQEIAGEVPLMTSMIAQGLTGRKGKGGFYRVGKGADGKRTREVIDLQTGDYRPEGRAEIAELAGARTDLRALLSSESKAGRYAWSVYGPVLAYATKLVPETADEITAVDEAMRLGYAWRWGPFELIDKLGTAWFAERLRSAGIEVPPLLETAAAKGEPFYTVEAGHPKAFGTDGAYHAIERPDGVLLLEDVKRISKPVLRNSGASLWDIGDGVACFEITAKAAAIDSSVMELLDKSITLVGERFKAMVLYGEGKNFSVGANLGQVIYAANIAAWGEIETLIASGQAVVAKLKRSPFPVVAAPSGMALGGGCELLLHSDAIQAHAETYAGLVEGGVGLIPGWGGCKELLLRWRDMKGAPKGPMPSAAKAFELIGTAKVSGSAAEAREMGILRPADGISMNRDRLLADAKARALSMVDGYKPPAEAEIRLPGPSGRMALELALRDMAAQKLATPHDVTVGRALAGVLTGGEADIVDVLSEADLMTLERQAFLGLLKTKPTVARIEHMLETGKPLRN